MTILGSFLARKRQLAEAARNFAARFEVDWLTRLVTRERETVADATMEATAIIAAVEELLADWRAALADGQLTPAERRALNARFRALITTTTGHHATLSRLV